MIAIVESLLIMCEQQGGVEAVVADWPGKLKGAGSSSVLAVCGAITEKCNS